MDFIDRLKALSASAEERIPYTRTEEATKTALVLPFLQVLGYDVFNPQEVVPEYVADVGTKKGEKVDYAVFREGSPAIIIECKVVGAELDAEKITQLFRYFASTTARFGILTDGIVYQFYSDLEEPNKMDTKPFMVFDLTEVTDEAVRRLKRFARDSFDMEDSLRAAENLKYTTAIKWLLEDTMRRPHRDLVRFIIERVHGGVKTKALIEKFTDLTRQAFREFINDKISARLQTALEGEEKGREEEPSVEPPEPETDSKPKPGVETTQDELRAFEIVKEILKDIVPEDRLMLQDTINYCNIVLDGSRFRNVVRMRLDRRNRTIEVYDEAKAVVSYPIKSPESIWEHAEAIRARAKRLLEG